MSTFITTDANSYSTLQAYKTYLESIPTSGYTNQADYNNHVLWVTSAMSTNQDISDKQSEINSQDAVVASKLADANALKSSYDAAMLVPEADRTTEQVASIDAYNAAYQIYIESVSAIEVLRQQLNDLQVLYDDFVGETKLNWNPPPTDSTILSDLQTLLNQGDTKISDIQASVSNITSQSAAYTQFVNTMSVYQQYETLISQQLQQLESFFNDDAAIDGQESTLSDLSSSIVQTITNYRDIVAANNTKASLVHAKYTDANSRILTLNNIANGVQSTMNQCKNIIKNKRTGGSYPIGYNPVVMLPFMKTTVLPSGQLSLDTTNSIFTTVSPGVFSTIYNFQWETSTKRLKWVRAQNDTSTQRKVEFKFEVLSSKYTNADGSIKTNSFDVTTQVNARVYDELGQLYATLSNVVVNQHRFWTRFSSVFSSTHNGISITLANNHSVEFTLEPVANVNSVEFTQILASMVILDLPTFQRISLA